MSDAPAPTPAEPPVEGSAEPPPRAPPTPAELVEGLAAHPQRSALIAIVRQAAMEACAARRTDFASRLSDGSVRALPSLPEGFVPSDAETPYGNVIRALELGVSTPTEAMLLGTLLALSVREPAETEEQELLFAANATWLATHTPCDALLSLDAAAGEREGVWRALSRVALEPAQVAADFGRTEALVAAAALGSSTSASALPVRVRAVEHAQDAPVRALLAAGGASAEPIHGEMAAPPFGPFMTALLALTLVLFVWHAVRLIGRFAFAYRRPAALTLTERGLELTYHVELLGKVLRDRSAVVPLSNLARVTREVKYARGGLYAGLAALVLGTYFGMGLFVDGLRVPGGSASLLAMAVALIVSGIALDFVLSSALDSARGRCSIVVVPRKGRALCVANIDVAQADTMLSGVTAVATSAALFPERAVPAE
jgi:hypothetical protein